MKEGNKKLIDHQEENNYMRDTSFTSHLEGMALRDENVVGGSGYVEATVRDMGFAEDKTEGTTGTGPTEKRKRKPHKGKDEGGAILALGEIETDPRGDPSLKAPLWPRAHPAPARSTRRRSERHRMTCPPHGPWEAVGGWPSRGR